MVEGVNEDSATSLVVDETDFLIHLKRLKRLFARL